MPAPPATYSGHIIPVEVNRVRGFISNVLKTLGWDKVETPREFRIITAFSKETKQGMSQWNFSYKLTISYRKHNQTSTVLNYELTEEKQNAGTTYTAPKLKTVIETIHQYAGDFVETREEEEPPTTYGAARFATEADLIKAGYLTDDIDPQRLVLAPYPGGRFITIPQAQTCWHALICGPTGAGKSSGFFIPNIVKRYDSSALITEATAGDEVPELYAKTAGWRHFKGSKIYFFNPGYCKGTRINPLDKLKYAPQEEFSAVADELAELVIINTSPPTSQRTDPIWDKAEKHLLWILIMHVSSSGDPELAHFGAIREIVRKSEKQIQAALKNSTSQIAREEFDSFLSHSSENFRHGVFAGLLGRLNPWLTDRVVTMTKTTDINLDELREELFTFYLSVPSRKRYLKPIGALVFNFLLDMALEKRFKHPLALILDEFTNFGAIPGMDEALSIIRKRNLPVVLGMQTFKQLEKLYGRDVAGTIVSQLATRVFFRPRHRETAEEISRELGDQTILKIETDDQGRTSVREIGRKLMAASDLATLPENDVIIMTPTTSPLRVQRFTYDNFPAPEAYDAPDLPVHSLVKTQFIENKVVIKEASKAKHEAEAEHDFKKHKEQLVALLEEKEEQLQQQHEDKNKLEKLKGLELTPKKKQLTPLRDENWDVPG